jgi:hypothetical protein
MKEVSYKDPYELPVVMQIEDDDEEGLEEVLAFLNDDARLTQNMERKERYHTEYHLEGFIYEGTDYAQYRRNAIWVMNDNTALYLRKLKDADGNYLWNHNNDSIMGKPVFISEFMPDMESGKKPIAFGDFSYYWIVNRKPLSVRTLQEKFALHDQTGYLAQEYLDGKLIRQDAIVTMQMK